LPYALLREHLSTFLAGLGDGSCRACRGFPGGARVVPARFGESLAAAGLSLFASPAVSGTDRSRLERLVRQIVPPAPAVSYVVGEDPRSAPTASSTGRAVRL